MYWSWWVAIGSGSLLVLLFAYAWVASGIEERNSSWITTAAPLPPKRRFHRYIIVIGSGDTAEKMRVLRVEGTQAKVMRLRNWRP